MDEKILDRIYKEELEKDIILEISKRLNISINVAMDKYYNNRFSEYINKGLYGIENLDYRYLTNEIIKEI